MKRNLSVLILIAILVFTATGTATAGNPNPGVIPNNGHQYEQLGILWWQWALGHFTAVPLADIPYMNAGGAVDISVRQSGHTWFLAGQAPGAEPVVRTGTIPTGTRLFFPLANFVNDYPCPDPNFQPGPGETMEQFLQRTGNEALDYYLGNPPQGLFAEIDGVPLTNLQTYRATSPLFYFTADPALAPNYDPCATGQLQPGVAVGYWLLLTPLTPGTHTLHFGTPALGQDITYVLTVTPGR